MKRIAVGLVIVIALVFGASVYFLGSELVPDETEYEVDLEGLRALAESIPGGNPMAVRFETIATGGLPRGLILAGESFDVVDMPRPVFQVLYADGSYVLIDSAYDRELHEETPGNQPFFDAAWDHLVVAMENASHIVVTHEHSDHLGGVARHPRPEKIAPNLRLTPEQIESTRSIDARLPKSLRDQLESLQYEDAIAIAPGVVLKKAAGHTPGSQMVYVRLADDRELLFVGDIVWNLDAITELIYRPRLVTDLVLDEDRAAVLDQIRALRDLYDTGQVAIVVSHDARTFQSAELREGFSLPHD